MPKTIFRTATCSAVMVLLGLPAAGNAGQATIDVPVSSAPAATDNQQPWSNEVDGLSARLSLRVMEVFNGTPILSVYLELRNSRNLANAMTVPWPGNSLKFSVTEVAGKEVPQNGVFYDGMEVSVPDLVLPHDSTICVNLSKSGAGVAPDQAALLDLGAEQTWELPRDHRDYMLLAVLDIPAAKTRAISHWDDPWHGRIEIPAIHIFSPWQTIDPDVLGRRINELGAAMLGLNGRASEQAMRDLSLIDDPRVVPWYVKGVNTNSYELKFAALDRLSRFAADEALAGLKKGTTAGPGDIANCTTPAVAAGMAENIRCEAVQGLMRSPNPRSGELIVSMAGDSSAKVRIEVAQATAKMQSTDSLDVLKKLCGDPDATVRAEAQRCLKIRVGKG